MALTTPILFSQVAFDSRDSNIFSFDVIGGDQVVKNRLVIMNQSTGNVVYDNVQTTYSFSHELSENVLSNGVYYSAYVITYNSNGTPSARSNLIQFYCYSNPTFQFTNLPDGNIIQNSSFSFEVTYRQNEGELLDTYSFTLYDARQIQVATSGVKYVGSNVGSSTIIKFTFSGLSDGTNYYIKANGQTEQGTLIETDLISINVSYVAPNIFSIIELNNNCSEGYISIKSNIINIKSISKPSPPVYVDDNTAVDARKDGRYVEWNDGFSLSDDFTLSLWGKYFNKNSDIIKMSDGYGNTIVINYRTDESGKVYADATIKNGNIIYYIYSDSINPPVGNKKVQFWLRRISYQYEIKIAVIS